MFHMQMRLIRCVRCCKLCRPQLLRLLQELGLPLQPAEIRDEMAQKTGCLQALDSPDCVFSNYPVHQLPAISPDHPRQASITSISRPPLYWSISHRICFAVVVFKLWFLICLCSSLSVNVKVSIYLCCACFFLRPFLFAITVIRCDHFASSKIRPAQSISTGIH